MRFEIFKIGFIPVTVMDILDIAVMSYIIYRLYTFLRGSRASQMMVGLVIIMVFSVIAPLFQLRGMSWIFQNLRTVWLIAFVILFQPELRRLLIYVGQSRVVRYFVKVSGSRVVDEVVKSTIELRDRGYGALIVMGRETGLRSIIETGVQVQAEVTVPLLVSIFNPRSPLHDGAVIVQNDIIQAASCILPLADIQDKVEWGTRHRAAIGLSQETDALVIVVSEETGKISIAAEGVLHFDLSEDRLKNMLIEGLRYGNLSTAKSGKK